MDYDDQITDDAPPQIQSRAANTSTKLPSCSTCRRRKIKCDRGNPCSYCVRLGTDCAWSAPSGVPRGRQGGRRRKVDNELLARVQKLETLIKGMDGGNAAVTSNTSRIDGMREVLYQSSDDEDEATSVPPGSSSPSIVQTEFVICTPGVLKDLQPSLGNMSPKQAHFFYSSYMTNVEPAVKLLHGPSLRRYLVDETARLDCSPGPDGWNALKCAIYYITTTSLTPEECSQHLSAEKLLLLQSLRSSTEIALARADVVNTEEMSTLQALVLYLLAIRSNENTRRTWTLISLAVRIAQALGLHRDSLSDAGLSQYQPFERELRRRLWWQICVIDRHASLDRGSDPIITPSYFNTPLPLNINDDDIAPDSAHAIRSREEYTDTTLSLVCHEVFDVERRLNYYPVGESDGALKSCEESWAERRKWVVSCEDRIEDKYLRYCSMAIPVQRYTKLVADIMIATLWLWAYRPLQKHPHSPSSVDLPYPGILQLSVEVMEKAIRVSNDISFRPYTWITSIWVQWHALAVTIAELCVQTTGTLVERAWSVVDSVYEETARHIADSDKGRLWRPVKKIMTKASQVRNHHLQDSAITMSSVPFESTPNNPFQSTIWRADQLGDPDMTESEGVQGTPNTNYGFAPPTGRDDMSSEMAPRHLYSWRDPMSDSNHLNGDYFDQSAWENWEHFIDDFQAT